MSLVPISSLPPDARAWCFGASQAPSADALRSIKSTLARFLESWTAHREDLRAGFEWLHDRFLVVAVDESVTGPSGCSIDALTEQIRQLESDAGIELLDAGPIWIRTDAGDIRRLTRDEFREAAMLGVVNDATRVFDLTVDRLAPVRSGDWEVAAGRSWHARLL